MFVWILLCLIFHVCPKQRYGFLAHLAIVITFRLSFVVCRPSVNISNFNLLRNHWANCYPLPKLCPVIPTSSEDGHQAKNRKKGDVKF